MKANALDINLDLRDWISMFDWREIVKLIMILGDYKEVAILVITGATAVTLLFVRRSLRQAVADMQQQTDALRRQLEATSEKLHHDLGTAIQRLDSAMEVTLEGVDAAGDALAKKVDFVKREIEVVIEDALAKAKSSVGGEEADGKTHGQAQLGVSASIEQEDHWGELRCLWDKTKSEVDGLINMVMGQIQDGRSKRRYSDHLDKRKYEAAILKLYGDNWIDDESSDALLEMNLLFNSRRNRRRPVTVEELEKFKGWRNRWLQGRGRPTVGPPADLSENRGYLQ